MSRVFNYDLDDQASIIWHELYHLNYDSRSATQFEYTSHYHCFYSEAPSYIISEVEVYLQWRYKGTSLINNENEMLREAKDYLSVWDLHTSEYYMNEIKAYEAEIMECTRISIHYSCERDFNYWKAQQLYELAKRIYK